MATMATAGIAALAAVIGNAFSYVRVGTGTTAENVAHTGLVTEIAGMAEQATITVESNAITVWTATLTYDATRALRECSLFTAGTGGIMLMRHLWATARNGDAGETLTLKFKMANAQGA